MKGIVLEDYPLQCVEGIDHDSGHRSVCIAMISFEDKFDIRIPILKQMLGSCKRVHWFYDDYLWYKYVLIESPSWETSTTPTVFKIYMFPIAKGIGD